MTAYTRRQLLRDLGVASASLALPGILGCPDKKRADATQAPGPLYVVIQGPWLFSVEASSLHAVTADFSSLPSSDPMRHDYIYSNPRGGSPSPYVIGPGQTVNFSVTQTAASPGPASLFKKMLAANDGIFYDRSKVSLVSNFPSGTRHLYFPYPDTILSAGQISGASFALNGSVASNVVADWPAAMLLIYSNWTNATGPNADPILPIAGQPTFRRFTITRNALQYASQCDGQAQDAAHATMYFQSLTALLNFTNGASAPVPTLPLCPQPAVTIALGGDANLQCGDLGLVNGTSPTSCQPHASGPSPRGATLVNCAGGHGGITGCCN